MKTYNIDINSDFDVPNINLTIGNFDGVHVAHRKIIQILVEQSKEFKVDSAILCFVPHPRQYFTNNYNDFNIVNENLKIKLLNQLNVNHYITLKFDYQLASLSAHDFIHNILCKKLKINYLTVGYDFKFGKNRQGDVDLLQKMSLKYGYQLSIVDQVINPNNLEIYSSSLIRKNIKMSNFEKVSFLLGRNWEMQGSVVYGDKRARKFNFPTANIIPSNLIRPKKGVYIILAKYDFNYFKGIANFGERPTVDGTKLLLEVHLFDFNQNIYGKDLTVEFLTFIRDEIKFSNFDQLTEQIQKDIQIAKNYHGI